MTDLDLKKLLKSKMANPLLEERYLLYAPSGRMVKGRVNAILQGTTTAAVYAARPEAALGGRPNLLPAKQALPREKASFLCVALHS